VNPATPGPWRLDTLDGCELAIGGYPLFRYDARGGGAVGEAQACAGGDGLELMFPLEGITIPPLDGRTTTVLGLPLPPGLSISIVPQALTGQLQTTSGELQLWFRAAFRFRIRVGRLWQLAPPDLSVEAQLSSGGCRSLRHQRQGEARNGHGNTTVAGVATVPPCGAPWLDRFLGLPDEALAVLRCRLTAAQEPAETPVEQPCR